MYIYIILYFNNTHTHAYKCFLWGSGKCLSFNLQFSLRLLRSHTPGGPRAVWYICRCSNSQSCESLSGATVFTCLHSTWSTVQVTWPPLLSSVFVVEHGQPCDVSDLHQKLLGTNRCSAAQQTPRPLCPRCPAFPASWRNATWSQVSLRRWRHN